jgi:tetratricopeptide (TPR) repeat protein
VPWRDPHSVSPEKLASYIQMLERAAAANPSCPDVRTCLGMAYAMNFDVYKSMDTLEAAVALDGTHFFAQLKYSELLYRLRILIRAEEETIKAVELAGNAWELSLARKQLQEIRRLHRDGTQKPEWTKPLLGPTLVLGLMCAASSLVMLWK